VGDGSITINKGVDATASIWGKTTLKGGEGATITQKNGAGNVLNIGSTNGSAAANALTLDLGGSAVVAGASIILTSGTDPGKIAIAETTSTIITGVTGTSAAIGGVKTITIGMKSVTNDTFVAADYQVSSNKLVKIGGTTAAGFITASTSANADVTINSTADVSGS
jgi:hypothetical protein